MTRETADAPLLEARALAVGYWRGRECAVVLEDLDLDVEAGRLLGLLGANGSGKSTLLRTLGGMQPPLAGEVLLEGRPMRELAGRERARRLGMVLTERVRPGAMTVAELVSLGRLPHVGWAGRLLEADRRAVAWALERADVEALADRTVSELSDGERQRVMIARALAQEPAVLLLDEPTAFLDPPRRLEVVSTLRRLVEEEGLAVLVASHDLEVLLPVVDRVWLLVPEGSRHRLEKGGPEDLALSGALERAFAREHQRWDERRGSFVSPRPILGRARVEAQGARRLWAERALERAGWQPSEGSPEITLRATATGWRLDAPTRSLELGDLASVVESLRVGVDSEAGEPAQRKISSRVETPPEKRS